MRRPFIAGNWKMNTDSVSSIELAKGISSAVSEFNGNIDIAIIPPFVYINEIVKASATSKVAVGAQDIFYENKGAFTGEISAAMLKDIGCTYCLCGHSERRHVIGESDELVNKKVTAAINGGLLPILCVGEFLEERESEKTTEVITRQIKAGLAGLNAEKAAAVTLAYEPVWAIGTGLTATPAQAQEVHATIRSLVSELYSKELADDMRIQYGGSAKADNAADIMAQQDVDGLLVGGASLKAEDFVAIIKASV